MGADQALTPAQPVTGTVIELLESGKVRVELEDRRRVVAHAGAGSRMNFVRLRPGDQVAIVISPRDGGRGRIVKRLEPQARGRDRGIAKSARPA
jgi:translation initiation factor IF-1